MGLSEQSVASMRCLIIMLIHSGCHYLLHSWDYSIWCNKQLNDAMNGSVYIVHFAHMRCPKQNFTFISELLVQLVINFFGVFFWFDSAKYSSD